MTDERFWLLVSLKLAGEAPAEDLAELESHMQEFPEKRFHFEKMNVLWQAQGEKTLSKEGAFNRHMQRLSNHLSEPVLQYETGLPVESLPSVKKGGAIYRRMAWFTTAAASVFLVWFFALRPGKQDTMSQAARAQNEISTKKGSKSTKIQLPDGTEVWLNADSRISYNENFQGKIREVQLTGEAFFDVKKDESRPFVIHTPVVDIRVVGTAFNVRSYADEKNTETSLIRGAVEVTVHNNPDTIYRLKPNDKLIVDNNPVKEELVSQGLTQKEQPISRPLAILSKVKFKKNEINATETLWVRNKLAFDKAPLEEIALMIERWYDVKIHITNEQLKKKEFTGTFEDEDLKLVLEALHLGSGFNYTFINKKEVTIRP